MHQFAMASEDSPLDYQPSTSYNPNWLGFGNSDLSNSYGFGTVVSGGGGGGKYATFGQTPAYRALMSGQTSSIINDNGTLKWSVGKASQTSYIQNGEMYGVGELGKMYFVKVGNSNDTPWDAYKNWADYGSGTIGTMYQAIADQRTKVYNSGYWVDNLGRRLINTFASPLRVSSANYLRTTAMYGKFAKRLGYVGNALSVIEIGNGVYEDRGTLGKNTAIATAGAVGGIVGTAEGAIIGAYIGSFIPLPGAGTILGFVVGAGVGYIYGKIATQAVEKMYE